MLHEDQGRYPMGETSLGKAERCKPDYEAIIKRTTERLGKVVNLKSALFDYLGTRRVRKELAEMVGELVMEERELTDTINNAIADQEASS